MTEPLKRFKPDTKMVPVPSRSIIPERDVNHSPVLEASHLGIEFGGLKAVDDVNLAIESAMENGHAEVDMKSAVGKGTTVTVTFRR